jgi:tagatose-1,6-bisphosphate aldolase
MQTSTVFFVDVQLGSQQLSHLLPEGEKQGREWLSTEGKKNIENLNDALKGAKSWKDKLEVED